MKLHRRSLLRFTPLAFVQTATAQAIPAIYPSHTPELAKEMVGVSHGRIDRVRELLKGQPTLANASWDWGFGDWETALGAASHVGNRTIAELLIENGAPPTVFSATMLGQLDVVQVLVAAHPGVQRIPGPHSISLLAHARAGGERSQPVYDFLMKLGNAGSPTLAPSSEEAIASIIGTYVFGPTANDRIAITANKGQLEFKRAGGDARRLFHIGELAFHPAGAREVRIRFDGKGSLTVHDPVLILTGKLAD
jgi:hypothetical protein